MAATELPALVMPVLEETTHVPLVSKSVTAPCEGQTDTAWPCKGVCADTVLLTHSTACAQAPRRPWCSRVALLQCRLKPAAHRCTQVQHHPLLKPYNQQFVQSAFAHSINARTSSQTSCICRWSRILQLLYTVCIAKFQLVVTREYSSLYSLCATQNTVHAS
ncbi:hypothetical protein ABBQ32_008024 [Trebouxia sp. C0010 RCD-2024]